MDLKSHVVFWFKNSLLQKCQNYWDSRKMITWMLSVPLFYLLPQCFSGGQTGAGSYKPTVPQLALVQVMGTDAIHKQMRVAA